MTVKPIYYVYAYLREDLTPYYIGKGKDGREWKHGKKEIQPPVDKARVVILAHKLNEHESHLLEQRLIASYGRKDIGTGILRNKTNGGEGVSGRIVLPAARTKSSISNRETWAKPETLETHRVSCQASWSDPVRNSNISKNISGPRNARFGKPGIGLGGTKSEETRSKMRAKAALRKKKTPEERAAITALMNETKAAKKAAKAALLFLQNNPILDS